MLFFGKLMPEEELGIHEKDRSAQKSWPGFAFSTLERSGQKEVVVKQFEKHSE